MERKILVVEDEDDVAKMVVNALRSERFDADYVRNAEDALEKAKSTKYDMFIIDIILPGDMDGKELLKRIRMMEGYSTVPVIFLTALSESIDKIIGLELGADDYVTKPFDSKELVTRVKVVFRRIDMDTKIERSRPKKLKAKGLEMDLERFEVRVNGKKVKLTPLEFDLLRFLMENEGKVFAREVLLDRLWGYDYFVDTRTVDVHIRRLRTKIEENPSKPKYIITVRGKGYKFVDPGKEE